MFGWSIIARACRSASKRATTCLESMPGLMTFRATRRRTGCGLLGDVDDAHAPLADLLQQLVGADDRAGLLDARAGIVGDGHRGHRGRGLEEVAPPRRQRRGAPRRDRLSSVSPQCWSRNAERASELSSSRAAKKSSSTLGVACCIGHAPFAALSPL